MKYFGFVYSESNHKVTKSNSKKNRECRFQEAIWSRHFSWNDHSLRGKRRLLVDLYTGRIFFTCNQPVEQHTGRFCYQNFTHHHYDFTSACRKTRKNDLWLNINILVVSLYAIMIMFWSALFWNKPTIVVDGWATLLIHVQEVKNSARKPTFLSEIIRVPLWSLQSPGYYFKLSHDSSLPHVLRFTNYPVIPHYEFWSTDSIVN